MLKKLLLPAAFAAVLLIAPAADAHRISKPKTVKVSSTLVRDWAGAGFVFTESDRAYPLYRRWVVGRECSPRGRGHARRHRLRCAGWWIYEDTTAEGVALCRVFVDARLRKGSNRGIVVLKRRTTRCWDVTEEVTTASARDPLPFHSGPNTRTRPRSSSRLGELAGEG